MVVFWIFPETDFSVASLIIALSCVVKPLLFVLRFFGLSVGAPPSNNSFSFSSLIFWRFSWIRSSDNFAPPSISLSAVSVNSINFFFFWFARFFLSNPVSSMSLSLLYSVVAPPSNSGFSLIFSGIIVLGISPSSKISINSISIS